MTAMSLIVQPHAAYLLTDTAFYLADGTVVKFGPKVMELHFGPIVGGPPAYAAFALTGIITPDHVNTVIVKSGIGDLQGLVEALPEMVRGFSAAIPHAHRSPGVGNEQAMLLALAFWDHGTGKPYGLLIGNEASPPVQSGQMEPFTVVPMRNYVMQRAPGRFGQLDYSDPALFDPLRDGGEMLDDQRADPFGDSENQFAGVGGQGILTEIGPAGVHYHLLRTWPDKVGKRIAA